METTDQFPDRLHRYCTHIYKLRVVFLCVFSDDRHYYEYDARTLLRRRWSTVMSMQEIQYE